MFLSGSLTVEVFVLADRPLSRRPGAGVDGCPPRAYAGAYLLGRYPTSMPARLARLSTSALVT